MTRARYVLPLALVAISAQAQTIAITGGRVIPVSGPVIEKGTVVIRDGRVTAVGASVPIPADAQRINATGKWVTPGIFNAATVLGVSEVFLVASTNDVSAHGRGNGITPSFRVWDGYNSASPIVQATLNAGITTVGVVPTGGLLSGQAAVLNLGDGSLSDVLVKAPAAIFADAGPATPDRGASRGEIFERLREVLSDARTYAGRRAGYERNESRELAARHADLEAMQLVLSGKVPLVIIADRASDIEMALAIGHDFGIRLGLAGAAEAWKVAPKIAAAKAFVLTDAANNIPRTFDMLGARQDNATLLRKAGVPVAIAELNLGPPTGAGAFNARNIKYQAGIAVAFGLPWDEALRAVTLTPAEFYGVADRVGSLQLGKDATLVIWSGDPLELSTRAEKVFVRGREVQRPSRQDELMRRYRAVTPDFLHQP